MAMNEIEKAAVIRKLDYPDEDVKCPRCGESLVYRVLRTCDEVYCKNCEDVKGVVRGF